MAFNLQISTACIQTSALRQILDKSLLKCDLVSLIHFQNIRFAGIIEALGMTR